MTSKERTRTVYRDAIVGRFIRAEEARRRPRTTVKERVAVPVRRAPADSPPKGGRPC